VSEQHLTLAPRPEPDGEIIAVITAAAEQLLRPAVVVESSHDRINAWRYSGRWFAPHQVQRRIRPY
jgi:hypothetical protein